MSAQNRNPEHEMPSYDDGWWASVLADEGKRPLPPSVEQFSGADEPAKTVPDWGRAAELFKRDEIVTLTVSDYNRGGLLVDGDGLKGFVPCSHLVNLPFQPEEDRRDECFSSYLGRSLRLKIIECVPKEERLIFSERAARTEAGRRPVLLNTIQVGQHISGEVTNVTDFGVFVDLGGAEGLIHISELSWGRVAHPGQICHLGQHVEVLVMEVAPERCRIALSLKRLMPNPWENVEERYPVNSLVSAVVTDLVPFGAFARLEEGLEGLIHVSEMPLPPNGTTSDILSPGQSIQVRVLQVEASRQRLGLSMRLD